MAGKGNVGTSLGGMEFSPERKKRNAARRKRQEERRAAKSGEVRVSRIELDTPDRDPCDEQSEATEAP